jgi:hypothetical protein
MSAPLQIAAALAADSALAALVGTGVYPGELPPEAALPAVVYSAVGLGEGPVTHDSEGGWERPRFQFDCWCTTYAGAWSLAGALKTALRESDLGARIVGQLDLSEPATGSWRVVVDATVWTETEEYEDTLPAGS